MRCPPTPPLRVPPGSGKSRSLAGTIRGRKKARASKPRYTAVMPRSQGRLAFKIILPFALLTLVMGAIGTLAATSQLSARNQEAFDAQLIHDGFTAQAMTQKAETERLSTLRLLAGGPGLAA